MELDDCVVIENDIDIRQMESGGMNFICYISNVISIKTFSFILDLLLFGSNYILSYSIDHMNGDSLDSNGNLKNKPSKNDKTYPYPKGVPFIISTEFCERFSYYGMKSK